MKKKIFSLFMIFALCFCQVHNVYADAGSLVVAGGSIAVGGLGGAALAGLAGPVVVAVFVGMMAMGFDVELTQASEQAGMTKTQFVKSKIEQYCHEANITLGTFNDYILTETTVLKDGTIKLGNRASAQIEQFCNWLFANNDVAQPSTGGTGTGSHITQNGVNFPVLTAGQSIDLCSFSGVTHTLRYVSGPADFALFFREYSRSRYDIILFTLRSFITPQNKYFTVELDGTASTIEFYGPINNYVRHGLVVRGASGTFEINPDIPFLGSADDSYYLNTFDGTFNASAMDAPVANDTFTGTRDDYNTHSPSLDVDGSNATVINPGLIGQIPIPADKDLTIDVGEYLDAIQKVIDKLGEIEIPAVDDNDGIPITIEIPDTAVIDPTIDKEDDQDLPQEEDQTPVIDDNPVDPEKDPELAQAPLKFDIKGIFPFCIPFDIKNMLSKLSSEPVAPVYTVNWHIPIVNQNLNFTVDLTPFNDVASVARKMELLGLVIGLAIITRSMLIRG